MKNIVMLLTCGCLAACVSTQTQTLECNDGIRDGRETGVDCGGGACAPCAADLACKVDADCRSAICQDGFCAPLPAPGIASFTAAKSTLSVGASTTLTAVFSDGNATITPGVGAVISNQPVTVGPFNTAGDTVYTLAVDDGIGAIMTQTLTITAVAEPSIASLSASPTRLAAGGSTQLTAVFSGGDATISPGVGTVRSGVPVSSGTLTGDTTFTLTVTSAAGAVATQTASVMVAQGPVVLAFGGDANALLAGQRLRLSATFDAGPGGSASIDHGVGAITSGAPVLSPPVTANTNFVLTVRSAAGAVATRGLEVTATLARDCMEALASGLAPADGVCPVGPSVAALRNMWCDMTTDGGGWTRLYHGPNGAAGHFASFEGGDSCADPNASCLQRMPSAVGSDVQLLATCGASQVRFTPTAATLAYLKSGAVAGWQANSHVVSLQGGHAVAASAFLAGDAQGAGWMLNVTGDLTVPQVYGNASQQAAPALQGCGGHANDSNALSLLYREPVRMAQGLQVRATPVAGADDATPVAVRMLDQYGEVLTTATDSIMFTSSDGTAVLPVASNLVNGALTQNVTFKTAGAQWINASTGLDGSTLNLQVVAGAVGTAASPAQSCNDILAAGASAGDGIYVLAVNSASVEAYCDMTFDGGGWTLLMATREMGPALLPVGAVTPNMPGAVPVGTAQALAQGAAQVHLRTAGAAATTSVTSVAGSQAILNLRQGVQLSSTQPYDAAVWTGPASAPATMGYDASCTADSWPAVYRACGGTGLELAGANSRWSAAAGSLYANSAVEVYVR